MNTDIDSLSTAIAEFRQPLDELQGAGWHILSQDGFVGFYRFLKNGKPRKTPTFTLAYHADNVRYKWCVSDGGSVSVASAYDALKTLIEMAKAFDPDDPSAANAILLAAKPKKEPKARDFSGVGNGLRVERAVDELIGLCKGILFSGFVTFDHVNRLMLWFDANPLVRNEFIGRELYALVAAIMAKNALSSDDERQLLAFFSGLGGSVEVMNAGLNASCSLPLTVPAPRIVVRGSLFVLTGTFRLGSRALVTDLITYLGGSVSPKSLSMETDYLVIGDIGNTSWIHSTHGRKIEKAVALRDKGCGIAIVSEQQFMLSGAVMIEIAKRRLLHPSSEHPSANK